MTKPKKTENMSALDYLYKKLYWLGNKIEALSKGKVSKRDLLIYSFIVVFIVSVYFGRIIGGFTFVLAVATIWNIWITQGLLKQSKEAFERSRRALETDVFSKIVFSTLQLDAQLMIGDFSKAKGSTYVRDFATGMLVTLKNIDPSIFDKISQAIEIWHEIDKRDPAGIFYRALNEIKGKVNSKTKSQKD